MTLECRFSDDDKMVQDQINRLLRDNCGLGEFRSVLEGGASYSENVWGGLGLPEDMRVDKGVAFNKIPTGN